MEFFTLSASVNPKQRMSIFRNLLNEAFSQRRKHNPQYSLRAFARDLKLDASDLSKILRGQRHPGERLVLRLGQYLGIPIDQLTESLTEARELERQRVGALEPVSDFETMPEDAFEVLTNWLHYAVMELFQLKDYEDSPQWMASRLEVSVDEVKTVLERLERVHLIKRDEKNARWVETGHEVKTTTNFLGTSEGLKKMQASLFRRAAEQIDAVPLSRRDYSNVTMAIDTRNLAEAKLRMKRFRREMAQLLSASAPEKDEVYNLSLALFPLTRPQGRPIDEN